MELNSSLLTLTLFLTHLEAAINISGCGKEARDPAIAHVLLILSDLSSEEYKMCVCVSCKAYWYWEAICL